MCNIKLVVLMLALSNFVASAQFYTITRESEISQQKATTYGYSDEIKEDSTIVIDTLENIENEIKNQKKLACDSLKSQKSHRYKLPTPLVKEDEEKQGKDLPELTIPNLLAEMKKNNIKYPKIVLAQAILETGWFKSSVCRNKHNLFGLTNPRTKDYYEFSHWTESVKAYYTKVQYRYKGGNYLLWLDKIGYAEEKTYVRALIKLLKQL